VVILFNCNSYFFERRIGLENDKKSLNEKTRSLLRAKRRKTNIVLNTLIVIVLLLIVVVTVNVFFGDDKTASKKDAERASALSQSGQEKKDTNTDSQEKVRSRYRSR
jgi:Mn2+/Fe2+ NRAMP family transporter